MNCVCCGSVAVTERPEVTARGYRRFRCRACGRQFNERSGGVLNRTCLPSDVIAFVVFCRLRYRLTLRDLSEIMALRGIKVSHEAVCDWEAKLLPVVGDTRRKRRHGSRRGSGVSWHVSKTYLKVRGRWCYLYRVIDRDGNLIDAMLSEHRDMKTAKAFFRQGTATTNFRPDRVTTDGHGSYRGRSAACWARGSVTTPTPTSTTGSSRTISASRAGFAACAASRARTPPTASAENKADSATSSAPHTVPTRSFLLPCTEPALTRQHASRSASCRTRDVPRAHAKDRNAGAGADRTL